MALEFIPSQKGKPQLIRNGFIFNFQKRLANRDEAWICSQYYKVKCTARIRLNEERNHIVEENADHNHAPDAAKIGAKVVVNGFRQRAIETQEAPHQLIANARTGNKLFVRCSMLCMFGCRRNSRCLRSASICAVSQTYCSTPSTTGTRSSSATAKSGRYTVSGTVYSNIEWTTVSSGRVWKRQQSWVHLFDKIQFANASKFRTLVR